MRRKLIIIFSILLGILLLGSLAGGIYMLDVALYSPDRQMGPISERYDKIKNDYPEIQPWLDSLIACSALRDTFIELKSGERAHAVYAKNDSAKGRTAVIVHGYHSDHTRMMPYAYLYHNDMNMNIVLPDLHGHGLSEGNDVRMGWLDRYDVLDWTDRMRGNDDVVLHGLSMGGATVMMASGDELPPYIKAIVDDCGYTSVWDEFKNELSSSYGLPPFPVLYASDLLCRLRYGWSFKEASAKEQVAKSELPMLFIHGGGDTYVPTWMGIENYESKVNGDKELWIAPDSEHADSYLDHKEEYSQKLKSFVETHVQQQP